MSTQQSEDNLARALQRLEPAKQAYLNGESGAVDAVADAARAILDASGPAAAAPSHGTPKEKPSDFLQRVFWAEVRLQMR